MTQSRSLGQDLSKTAREAAYVAVGLGVIGFQRAQVRRRELARQLASAGNDLHGRLGDLAGASTAFQEQLDRIAGSVSGIPADLARSLVDVDQAVEALITRIEATMEPVEDRMPPAARQAVRQARHQAAAVRHQIRQRLQDLAA